jgi:hypothetical protein
MSMAGLLRGLSFVSARRGAPSDSLDVMRLLLAEADLVRGVQALRARFRDARGSTHFSAVFGVTYPASSFAGGTTTAPLQVMAFYSIEGTMSLQDVDQ